MLDKFLLIGLGGSGGATIRYTAASLQRALQRAGWQEGLPDAWQFLHVDAPRFSDVQTDLPRELDRRIEYLGLGRENNTYQNYDDAISSDPRLMLETAGWRPNPSNLSVRGIVPERGAGQMRAVGRVIGLRGVGEMKRSIEQSLARCDAQDSTAQLLEVEEQMREAYGDNIAGNPTRRIVIVTSWGGGAGSGLVTEVLDIINEKLRIENQGIVNNLVVIAFAPEVSGLDQERVQGVGPNSFAAMCEYLNVFESGKLAQTNLIMVGASARDKKMPMKSDRQVYRYVGASLAKLFSDPNVLREASAYVFQNPQELRYTEEFPFGAMDSIRAARSLGSASVSLGQDLFARYAAERLGSRVLRRLCEGHLEMAGEGDRRLPREQLIPRLVDGLSKSFFARTGLDEEGAMNQVLLALDGGEDGRSDTDSALNTFLDGLKDMLASGSSKRQKDEWIDETDNVYADHFQTVLSTEYRKVEERAYSWVRNVQLTFLDAVSRSVAQYGIQVTIGLIKALDASMETAWKEMRHDAAVALADSSKSGNDALAFLQALPDKVVEFLTRYWDPWAESRFLQLHDQLKAYRRQFAGQLLSEARAGLLGPTIDALTTLDSELVRAASNPAVQQWASELDIPSHLRPPENELVLIDPDAWPDLFARLVGQTFPNNGNPVELAIEEIVSGLAVNQPPSSNTVTDAMMLADPVGTQAGAGRWSRRQDDTGKKHQTLLRFKDGAEWAPQVDASTVDGVQKISRRAIADLVQFGAGKMAADLKKRSEDWVTERVGPFSDAVNRSLAEWVAEEPGARSTALATSVVVALDRSQPLLNVSDHLVGRVHGADAQLLCAKRELTIGKIPLSRAAHPDAYGTVEAALRSAGFGDTKVASAFDPDSARSDIEMISVGLAAFHPIVSPSLMTDICEAWEASPNRFRANRRAQGLDKFLPLDPRWQTAIARGYITAMILGHVPVEWNGRTYADGPVAVWTPSGAKRFTRELLGVSSGAYVSSNRDVVPHIVESFPVALIEFAGGDEEPLAAYARLVQLGAPGKGAIEQFDDINGHAGIEDLNRELAAWVANGTLSPGAPSPHEGRFGTAEMEPKARRDTIADFLQQTFRKDYDNWKAIELTPATAARPGTAWELRDVISSAIDELLAGLQAFEPDVVNY